MNKGFTLIELLIVVVVIGILAAGAATVINPAIQIQKALDTFYQDNGKYPDSSGGPNYKIKNTGGTVMDWGADWTPYIGNIPKDPADPSKNYVYASNGQTYYLYASLDRGSADPQSCKSLNTNGECSSVPGANLCGSGQKCNYGVSSPNVSP